MKTRILLTGDDGYNSIGTRLLIAVLRNQFDLTVVGTKHQQSAVGGYLNVHDGCDFGETTLEGVRALWVDGAPCDAMEFAHGFFKDPFDYVISGINLGENVGIATVSSGTVCAAVRSVALKLAPKAIAISWTTPPDFYFKKHDETESIDSYLSHPGETAGKVLKLAMSESLYGARMLNINLPRGIPKGVRFTHLSQYVDECYPPITIDEQAMRFSYPVTEIKRGTKDHTQDVEAMAAGFISLTPMNAEWTDELLYRKLAKKVVAWESL